MLNNKKNVTLKDPITTEVIRNALNTAAEEMNESLFRSSFSPIIYEMKDCSSAIFNKNAEQIGQSSGLPLFLGDLYAVVNTVTEFIGGRDNYKPGDAYILNDSYLHGCHLNDVALVSPIFYNKELVGFAANRAHWYDVGGKDPGHTMDATEIYQEGIRITPTKIYDAGEPRNDVINMIMANSRLSKDALGDMYAQIGACRTGENRLVDIIKKYGLDILENSIAEIFEQSEAIDKEEIRKISDGTYHEEAYLDNDGISDDPVLIKVKIVVSGDNVTFDLSGSSSQRPGMTNCGLTQTISACRVAFKHLTNPDSPVSGGSFKTLDIIVPERSIFNAQEPAACTWFFTPLGTLIDLITKALSLDLKEKSAAAHYGDSCSLLIPGYDESSNNRFIFGEPTAGGWGAFQENDGESGMINIINGNFTNFPSEVIEQKYPLKINQYGLRKNSGGAGETRGGLGIIKEYEICTEEANLYIWFERSKTPAWGLFGGESGQRPKVTIIRTDGTKESLLKGNGIPLTKGDRVLVETAGGGGFGHPFDRKPNEVLNDVINDYIDKEAALNDYGVVFYPETFKINHKETEEIRSNRSK